jgi:hypothetical protein
LNSRLRKCSGLIKILLLSFISCAAHTNLEPVGKKNLSANVSFGGPIVEAFGAKIPVPYTTVGANYGLDNRVDLNGNFHLITLPYKILGFDFGPTWFPIIKNGKVPVIGLQPRLLALLSLKSNVQERFKIYPVLSSSATWPVKGNRFYFGSDLTYIYSSADYDKEASRIIFSPFAGYGWKLGQKNYLYTEVKWHGANIQSNQLAVEYLPIGKNGALSVFFSLQRSF